ncbi:chromosome partitioning protein ParB [Sphingomonas sp. SFZ2018-12]|uniref:ParB/RepB/Spo0J family partition protein n=1 Tax=Sphingomonas sp. SFZ2018-12 TaxID=2683197 RepID=UPI001F0CF52C|nr:ParB N-terminal domain-containing protein [Sphingomonas sp. SFZ2018-12]MBX9815458.1 ParB N-terminal domain-containing protein [Sphingomonas sp.]MCH4894070.1 chromosome partitioning protein ParB [Sphingomonas sp. SFZ2018-12]
MKLDFIPLDKLVVSKANMRYGRKAPDVSDILPTVRSRGVIQPVIVRPNCAPDGFEIVAGSRRFHAAKIVAEERRAAGDTTPEPMPCAILDDGDDAAAIEASMIENMARLDPDEVTQWENFTRLVREGRKVEDIATTFGLPDLTVKRVLALGNLLPAIRDLYRKERIDATTVRHLTMASKSQQKAWLALADDENAYLPTGHQLKSWLFGGQSIPVKHALFDVEASGLATIADLFGEDRYIADADAFWTAQNAEIEARRAAYVEQGWADAIIVPPSDHFSTWEYEKAGKRKGGRVYIDVRATGEVIVHEGYVSGKEARRIAKAEGSENGTGQKAARPEVTSTMQTYVDLHRHAAVRAALTGHPAIALRLMVAHAIGCSHLWRVGPEQQSTRNDEVRDSLDNSKAEADFDERRRAVLAVLGFSAEEPTVTGGNGDDYGVVGIFQRLLDLPDTVVMEVIAIVMGETLASGSAAVEAVGMEIGVDMARCWQADDAFFELIRDREVLTRIVAEVAGETVASANAGEKTKTLKRIVRDHLDGTNGRERRENWVPRWMAFPPAAYTARGGVGTVAAHAKAQAAREIERRVPGDDEPDPSAPSAVMALPDPDEEGGADRLAA